MGTQRLYVKNARLAGIITAPRVSPESLNAYRKRQYGVKEESPVTMTVMERITYAFDRYAPGPRGVRLDRKPGRKTTFLIVTNGWDEVPCKLTSTQADLIEAGIEIDRLNLPEVAIGSPECEADTQRHADAISPILEGLTVGDDVRAVIELQRILYPGATLTMVLRSISSTGMYRRISVYTAGLRMISRLVYTAGVGDARHDEVGMGGSGMDMGVALADALAYTLYGEGDMLTRKWI